jgi:hypothetical protein
VCIAGNPVNREQEAFIPRNRVWRGVGADYGGRRLPGPHFSQAPSHRQDDRGQEPRRFPATAIHVANISMEDPLAYLAGRLGSVCLGKGGNRVARVAAATEPICHHCSPCWRANEQLTLTAGDPHNRQYVHR